MEKSLGECLENRVPSQYILPFFWQHGEEHGILREEIDAIQRSGIGEFCVESRVHEQFGREQWWEDLGFILQEAKKRKMRVWLLDDKSFPTGYANNYIASHPELRAVQLHLEVRDFAGIIRYDSEIEIDGTEKYHFMEFSEAGEIVKLWINGHYCGCAPSRPYRFKIGHCIKPGKNKIRAEVYTNLAYKYKDMLSSCVPLPISGLNGDFLIG